MERVVGAFVIAEMVALVGLVVGAHRPPSRRVRGAGAHGSRRGS
jgi:hypothetical protein